MDLHSGRCMDAEIFTANGTETRSSRSIAKHYMSRGSTPCFGTCSAGEELLTTFLGGGVYFLLIHGEFCTSQENRPFCFRPGEFCIDYVSSPKGLAIASCRNVTATKDEKDKWKFFFHNYPIIERITDVILLISILALTSTFLVYSCFRELRNFHGKCLLCHMASFIVNYVLLITRNFQSDARNIDNGRICFALDFFNYYFYMATFSWLNVICFDISMSFMNLRPRHANIRKTEWMKFALYSLYSWATPLAAFITSFHVYLNSQGLDFSNINIRKWCSQRRVLWDYYRYVPMSVYMVISVVLFVATVIRIYRINASTSILRNGERVQRKAVDENKDTSFKIYAKLLVLMGFMSWMMEPIFWTMRDWVLADWTYYRRSVWFVTVVFRDLQGLYISLFFLLNDKVRNLVKKRVFKACTSIIQHCIPQHGIFKTPAESSIKAAQNTTSSNVTVTTFQGSQGNVSEIGYMVSGNQGNFRYFKVFPGEPVKDAPLTCPGGSS